MTSTCKHCGKTIIQPYEGAKWWHSDAMVRGCRAATFSVGEGWDDTIDRRKVAEPVDVLDQPSLGD